MMVHILESYVVQKKNPSNLTAGSLKLVQLKNHHKIYNAQLLLLGPTFDQITTNIDILGGLSVKRESQLTWPGTKAAQTYCIIKTMCACMCGFHPTTGSIYQAGYGKALTCFT